MKISPEIFSWKGLISLCNIVSDKEFALFSFCSILFSFHLYAAPVFPTCLSKKCPTRCIINFRVSCKLQKMIIKVISYSWNNRKCWRIFLHRYNFVATRIKCSTMILFPAIKSTPWFCAESASSVLIPLTSSSAQLHCVHLQRAYQTELLAVTLRNCFCAGLRKERCLMNRPNSQRMIWIKVFRLERSYPLLWIVSLSRILKWQNNLALYIFCKCLHWILSLHHIWHAWNPFRRLW